MSGEEQTFPINDEDTSKSVFLILNTNKNLVQLFIVTFFTFSAGFLIWNYYVTMPMPASTLTLAVGHWQQVTGEIPLESGEGVGERADWSETAKIGAGSKHWTQAELVSGIGCSVDKVVMGSPVQNSRYFINFPSVFFFSSQFNLAL